jgi:hypothetical protein
MTIALATHGTNTACFAISAVTGYAAKLRGSPTAFR